MKRHCGLAIFVGSLLTFGSVVAPQNAAARTNRALLVGVTEYVNLPKGDWLDGPANDVELVRDYLLSNPASAFSAENITLLATGIEGAKSPTRAAIMTALDQMAAQAENGDFVYVHFSGHGSQQPARVAGTEQDGKDEIFLPADASRFDPEKNGLPNVIIDDEFGGALDAIRDKGAFVWVLFDACNSGTATRAAGLRNGEVERKISPEALGIPKEAWSKVEATRGGGSERENALGFGADEAPAGPTRRGGIVAFFAAQTVETTPELFLPEDKPGATKFGLFTYTMISKLAENPRITYRQLGQSILQHYSGLNRTKPTPLFEGDLDVPVFGTDLGDTVLQWKIIIKDGVATLPAGVLHRVTPGTKLAILPSPLSEMTDAIGYLDVRSATNLTSQLLPAAFGGRAALRLEQIPAEAYARVAEFEMNFELVVARPPVMLGLDAHTTLTNAALDRIAADNKVPLKLKVVGPEDRADIRLAVMRESEVGGASIGAVGNPLLWLLPPSGEITLDAGKRPPAIDLETVTGDALIKALSDNLIQISRATNLSRLAGASDFRSSEVSVTFLIQRKGSEDFEPIEFGKVPFLHPGDSIFVKASNMSRRPVDMNVLYVGSDYTISSAAEPIRLFEREELPETGLFTVSDGSFGNEKLLAVLTEAAPQSPLLDLGYLAQRGVRQMTRSAGAPEGFLGMLSDIATAPATREVKRYQDKRSGKGAVLLFPMETAPAPE
jgi:hypothetical protein